ncbi:MAG: adenylosuccinate synthase [Bifidobacteriaceae bacterium]|nr:adenylosuccinate synthase [Bifidobacteriaceae bacterium]
MSGIILLGMQWGDEGKGKATDLLGNKVDCVVKFNGGNNAGHTVVIKDKHYALHLLPSGILNPKITPVIANGAVIDIKVLFDELDQLKKRGIDTSKLLVSGNAHIITKYHRQMDLALENDPAKKKIGTTQRGIGPAYADKISRSGIRVYDLFSKNTDTSQNSILQEKIASSLASKNKIFANYGQKPITSAEVLQEIEPYLDRLRPMVTDTSKFLNTALNSGKKVLFEGGQGTCLDIDFGTYPYVTSSNCTAGGALTGAGIPPTKISHIVGILKAYTTRVGEGPFPTELYPFYNQPAKSDQTVDDPSIGKFLLEKGHEYGVTTGRARRIGWADGLVAKYSAMINGITDIVLTKLDVLTGLDTIKICTAYKIDGKIYQTMPANINDFFNAKPIYSEFAGWKENIKNARKLADLPYNAQKYVKFLEKFIGARISLVGVGPQRDEIIKLHNFV